MHWERHKTGFLRLARCNAIAALRLLVDSGCEPWKARNSKIQLGYMWKTRLLTTAREGISRQAADTEDINIELKTVWAPTLPPTKDM